MFLRLVTLDLWRWTLSRRCGGMEGHSLISKRMCKTMRQRKKKELNEKNGTIGVKVVSGEWAAPFPFWLAVCVAFLRLNCASSLQLGFSVRLPLATFRLQSLSSMGSLIAPIVAESQYVHGFKWSFTSSLMSRRSTCSALFCCFLQTPLVTMTVCRCDCSSDGLFGRKVFEI